MHRSKTAIEPKNLTRHTPSWWFGQQPFQDNVAITSAFNGQSGVIVVTHDQRTPDVFDTIYEMEDGVIHQLKRKVESATVPELVQK